MLYHLLCTARLCIAHFRAGQFKPCVILVSKLCACYRWQQLAGPSAASPVSPLPAHQRINTLGVTVMVLLTQGICTTASNSCASKGRLHAQQQSHDPVLQIITPIADSEVGLLVQALSVNLRQQTLDNAGRNITRLNSAIERAKSTDAQRLKDEYQRLVRGLQTQGNLPSADPRPAGAGGEDWLANPALPEDIMREAVRMPC